MFSSIIEIIQEHKKKIKENTNLTTLPSLRALNIIKTVEISFE